VHDVPPGNAVEVPSAHASHEVFPVRACTVPAAQGVHVADEVAPMAEDTVPAGQDLHPPPATSEYVPAGHCAHVVAPAVLALVPGAHAVHCASVAESVAALAVFAGHVRHSLRIGSYG
jgi:hypothetical protein